jgi:hypothetical protein
MEPRSYPLLLEPQEESEAAVAVETWQEEAEMLTAEMAVTAL